MSAKLKLHLLNHYLKGTVKVSFHFSYVKLPCNFLGKAQFSFSAPEHSVEVVKDWKLSRVEEFVKLFDIPEVERHFNN